MIIQIILPILEKIINVFSYTSEIDVIKENNYFLSKNQSNE